MTSWWDDKMTWWDDKMTRWLNDKMTGWLSDKMTVDEMTKWHNISIIDSTWWNMQL